MFVFEYSYLYLNNILTYLYLFCIECSYLYLYLKIFSSCLFVFAFEKSENLYLYLKKTYLNPALRLIRMIYTNKTVTDMKHWISDINDRISGIYPSGIADIGIISKSK